MGAKEAKAAFVSKAYRKKRRRQAERRIQRIRIVTATVATIAVGGAIGGYYFFDWLRGDEKWPTIDTLTPGRIGQNSFVYASDGTKMGVIPSDQNRTVIKLRQSGKFTGDAVVAIEDRRFLQHPGVDAQGIARAAIKDIKEGHAAEGASTITQQVVRNLYPQITREKTLSRKAKEATLALELEEKWAKDKILETYLNLVFFGNNAYGIEAAAQTYFSKHARSLTLEQSALLAGLPQKPSAYDPFTNKEDAKTRRDRVLEAMFKQEMISEARYTKAINSPIVLKRGTTYVEHRLPYVFDYVQQQLIKQYGPVYVRQGGLRIQTTVSIRLQELAERAIRETLNQPGDPSAAMVVIDTRSGEIKALASSAAYTDSKFNIAAQSKRQPGSTAKIWGLAALVAEGFNPDEVSYTSRPLKIRYKGSTEWWEPKTYSGSYSGTQSVASATIRSDNSVFAQLGLDLTPEKVNRVANRLGIESDLQPVWSSILGSQVVTPLEQTNFYSTIARGGVRKDPTAIQFIKGPSGTPVKVIREKEKRVLSTTQARKIVEILENNMTSGTGTGAQIGRPAAGKTGTTDDHKDAWFCGMTPHLTACVWMGHTIPTPMYSVHGVSVAGGTFPATMWKKFMDPALSNREVKDFFEVEGVWNWLSASVWDAGHWMDDPGLELSVGADPTKVAEEDEDDKKKKEDEDAAAAEDTDTAGAGTTPPPPSPPPATTPPASPPPPSPPPPPPAPEE